MPLPIDPHPGLVPFAPAATRSLQVFGAPVELVLVPERKARPDRVSGARPPFRRSPAARIVASEAIWRGDGLVATPNRYPFAAAQRLLWPEERTRELGFGMWRAIAAWVAASGGTGLVNGIGAAATIARAHAHLTPERLPFLRALPERRCDADLIEVPAGAELWHKDVPLCLLSVRGDADARAEALMRLAEARLTAAWNVVVAGDTAWVMPRSIETPAPSFPYPLGAAELWGRWCYMDEQPFAAARGEDLERALVAGGAPRLA
ncbi:MAG: hypothetical protein WAT39_11055 [Planctomycetota bacterium]